MSDTMKIWTHFNITLGKICPLPVAIDLANAGYTIHPQTEMGIATKENTT